ncbi:MAG: MarR family transcriptional regulator [Candidatus Omnitrophota bacterium]|jgi:DNA-binding MarR family transcriptional regulator|nr:MAG: MarR family transcriptional regulator [Candidatus Omnitrophota bacterium]
MPANSKLCDQVLLSLRRITRAIDVYSKSLVRSYGLTGPQLIILKELAGLPEMSVGDLAKNISLSNATVTDILDRLEKRELVKRTRCNMDRRKVMVKVTDSGRELLFKTPSLLQERFEVKFAELQEWEQTLILSSLQRIAAMMDTKDLETPVTPLPIGEPISDFVDAPMDFMDEKVVTFD